ncbi:Ap2-like ethylene-responsive transcription factor [Thalictrum thalictroides]|uniref:Ap2-like ethylene-responsive transcription factor n=1 Tax=Thalictrum thalictroides TaxID=46969 RepID=A0A7J6X4T2_THATH|nr:Ap2-like ethylene-responsive transcription factor [Thalictrum thalictroides]
MAAIEYRGLNAVTNFDLSRYIKWLRPGPTTNNDKNPTDPSPSPNTSPFLNTNHSGEMGFSPMSHQNTFGNKALVTKPAAGTTASSALGLLLQSPKFKEMLERTSAADCLSSPLESDPLKCSFPEDIQTYFGCQDSSNYTEVDDVIFGDLNSFSSEMFECELDA